MSRIRKRLALYSDQPSYGSDKRQPGDALLWSKIDANKGESEKNTKIIRPKGKQTGKVLNFTMNALGTSNNGSGNLAFANTAGGLLVEKTLYVSKQGTGTGDIPLNDVQSAAATSVAGESDVNGQGLVLSIMCHTDPNLSASAAADTDVKNKFVFKILDGGFNYKKGDKIVFTEVALGGATAANLLELTVSEVN